MIPGLTVAENVPKISKLNMTKKRELKLIFINQPLKFFLYIVYIAHMIVSEKFNTPSLSIRECERPSLRPRESNPGPTGDVRGAKPLCYTAV